MKMKRQAGFTMQEVVLALVLVFGGLVLFVAVAVKVFNILF
jgi:type II secretory pathway component PulJ